MKLLEERILRDGAALPGDILKVGNFLNQQLDIPFLAEVCKEFYHLYKDEKVTKILTIEASGIAIASLAAIEFNVPVVFAKKSKTANVSGDLYTAEVISYTHGVTNTVIVPKDYICKDDRILVIDDFLARGQALEALISICEQAGASVVGCGVAIEKVYQGGGNAIRARGIRVEALASVSSLEDGAIHFSH